MLNDYLKDCTRIIRDFSQRDVNPKDLIKYVNTARKETAGRAQCIRRLTPVSGSVDSILVTSGGTNYSDTPTVTISGPDFPSAIAPFPQGKQATAQAIVIGGVIQSIDVIDGGSGYFQPKVTITDPTGTGATATAHVPGLNLLNIGQEVYNFSDIDLSTFPGVESVISVKSVSVIYSNFRYLLPCYSFSIYQTRRSYTQQYQFVPTMMCQYGQGTDGSFMVYPFPSQSLQSEFDLQCIPSDLVDNNSYEAIPDMWREGIKWYAASLAMLSLQNFQGAAGLEAQFDKYVTRFGNYARPGRAISPGRTRW